MLDQARPYFGVDYQVGEKRLIQKVDFFILTFCCFSYLVNYVGSPVHAVTWLLANNTTAGP